MSILIIAHLHWYTNNNKCWYTVKQNELLGIDINTGFRDFIAIFNNSYPEVGTIKKRNLEIIFTIIIYILQLV